MGWDVILIITVSLIFFRFTVNGEYRFTVIPILSWVGSRLIPSGNPC